MAVAQHGGPYTHACAKRGGRRLRAELAGVSDADGRHDDGEDDRRIEPLARERGRGRRKDEQQQQRTANLPEQHAHSGQRTVFPKFIWTVFTQPFVCLGRGQSLTGRAELPQEIHGLERPVGPVLPIRNVGWPPRYGEVRKPVSRQHREPETETAEQQRRRERHGDLDAGHVQREHRCDFKRAQSSRQNAHGAEQACNHEAREDAAERSGDTQRENQNPNRRRVEQHNRALQAIASASTRGLRTNRASAPAMKESLVRTTENRWSAAVSRW